MTTRILLSGAGTPGHRQHHQRDMYLPAVLAAGWNVVGVVADHDPRTAELAAVAGVPVVEAETSADLVICCPDTTDHEGLERRLAGWAAHGVPVLLDKPTLFDPAFLAELASRYPDVVPAHHPRFSAALATARARVRTGGLGLLHAVHGELLVGPTDGPHPFGELRNLAVYALDVVQSLIGDLHGRLHAVVSPAGPDDAGESITLSLRCRPDVVVTLLIGRSGGAPHEEILHRYRILGSHGQLLVDVESPAMQIVGRAQVPFGASSVQRLIEAVLDGTAGIGLRNAAALGQLLSAAARSAAEYHAIDF